MNRSLTGTVMWICLAGAMGASLFFIKHEVKELETGLGAVHRDIVRNQDEIHVLNAEWSYLNDPARLRDLAVRHLAMKQLGPAQVATLGSLSSGSALVLEQRVHQAQPAAMVAAHAAPSHTVAVAAHVTPPAHPPGQSLRPGQSLHMVAMDSPRPQARPHAIAPTGLAMASSLAEAR